MYQTPPSPPPPVPSSGHLSTYFHRHRTNAAPKKRFDAPPREQQSERARVGRDRIDFGLSEVNTLCVVYILYIAIELYSIHKPCTLYVLAEMWKPCSVGGNKGKPELDGFLPRRFAPNARENAGINEAKRRPFNSSRWNYIIDCSECILCTRLWVDTRVLVCAHINYVISIILIMFCLFT